MRRFWDKVERGPRCWIWIGARNAKGYGTILYAGRVQNANRVAWMITYSSIPAGMNVLHCCDDPSCVNPEHLFLGTQQDNMDDMYAKGRDNPWGTKY